MHSKSEKRQENCELPACGIIVKIFTCICNRNYHHHCSTPSSNQACVNESRNGKKVADLAREWFKHQ